MLPMKSIAFTTGIFLVTLSLAVANNWPAWRGPLANGVAPEADPPTEWSETKNVKWKVAIPGRGTATPIIWGDRVFILAAITPEKTEAVAAQTPPPPAKGDGPPDASGGGRPRKGPGGGGFGRSEKPTDKYQFTVMCLDRKTGKTLWQKVAREEVPHEGHHPDHGFASGSPTTDGKLLLVYFGSRGLHCYDLDGNRKWEKDFGDMRTRNSFGEGTSPALHENTVVVNWDDETENDFILALDKNSGNELWKKPRAEETGWATPLIVQHGNKTQVIVNATGKVRSYDLASGTELWSCSGQTPNAIPTPVADAETVYVTSGFRGSALYAIKLDAKGDVAGTDAVRWSYNKNTPYVPSPLLVDGLLYTVKGNSGTLSCFDAKTGKPHFEEERLTGISGIYASPVTAKDRVYILGRDGTCLVMKKGTKLEVLATNKLNEKTDSSIALVGKELFVRGHESLYCIAEK
jgi:outer membrane protein assembly factor BamB